MLGNIIQMGIALIMGIICLVMAIFFKAHWHYFTVIMCFVMAYFFYVDNYYHTSIKDAIKNRRGK